MILNTDTVLFSTLDFLFKEEFDLLSMETKKFEEPLIKYIFQHLIHARTTKKNKFHIYLHYDFASVTTKAKLIAALSEAAYYKGPLTKEMIDIFENIQILETRYTKVQSLINKVLLKVSTEKEIEDFLPSFSCLPIKIRSIGKESLSLYTKKDIEQIRVDHKEAFNIYNTQVVKYLLLNTN